MQGGAADTIFLQHQHSTLPAACFPLPAEFIYISDTLRLSTITFDCNYTLREISNVAMIFLNVFLAFQCLVITFSKFIHAKERICVGYLCVVTSFFKATDSFYLENLCVLGK